MIFTPGNNKEENRKGDCDVLTFAPEERTDIIKRLKDIDFNNEALKENYQTINWFDFDCITVLMKGDDILGFSSIWHRSKYYRKGEVRVLNRYWEDPSLRQPGHKLAKTHIISTINHQLAFAKQLGYTSAFISREKNPRMFRKLLDGIENKTNTVWSLSDKKVCVCKEENPSCWQYKGETKL